MSNTETLSVHALQQTGVREQAPTAIDNHEQANRQRDSDKKRLLALVGSALSQLPIWGIAHHLGNGFVADNCLQASR
jgi:hypothetical protein